MLHTLLNARFRNLLDVLRTSFWFVPVLLCVTAIALVVLFTWADATFADSLTKRFPWLLLTAETAQTILSTITSAMFTVAGVVFSITFVTLSIASSQLGPRLLRTFMGDNITHFALGIFLGTGIYSLLVLTLARSVEDATFAPGLSVMVGVILCVFSMGALIWFIHNVANLVQAPNVVRSVALDLDDAIERLYPVEAGHGPQEAKQGIQPDERIQALGKHQCCVRAETEGYLQAVDVERLIRLARRYNLIVRPCYRPGHFVTRETPLVLVWGCEEVPTGLSRIINRAFITGARATPRQDVESAAAELAEVAVRALSPSMNDPFTAIHCIDHLGAQLSRLAQRELPSSLRYDDENQLRLILQGPAFPDVLEAAFNPIREYAGGAVAVIIRMLERLAVIGQMLQRDEDRAEVRRQAAMIMRMAERTIKEQHDLADVRERFEALGRALAPETFLDATQNAAVQRNRPIREE